ncbi:MAG: hypothetical protein WC943_03175 [Elusimicrobiota bacterium]|jgi:hypothetical protein
MTRIRLGRAEDIGRVMDFIGRHWSPGHVLSRSRSLMDWQHQDRSQPDRYNWLLAEREGDLLGILGFIPTSLFDRGLAGNNCTWLSLWKVRDDARHAGLGLGLLRALEKLEPSAPLGVLGINPAHPPMYRALGYKTGQLAQHAVFNPGAARKLAAAPASFPLPLPRPGDAVLRPLTAVSLDADCVGLKLGSRAAAAPAKTPSYFLNRYLRHPIYRYDLRLVEADGRAQGLLATRVAEHGGARALRIVDFLGESSVLGRCGSSLGCLLEETGAEYADLWEHGLDRDALAAAGFSRVEPDGPLIVPNHFEPFTGLRSRIEFAVRGHAGTPFVIMRGDGDQDRPNALPGEASA